jgi:glyoxylase-like metal-dependent hydrolase (beta-lactamase superfamily II)
MSVQAISTDIYQVTLPLPFALRSVNCYLLRGGEGWTVVDCGLNTSQGRETWHEAFAELGFRPQDVHQIVLTHAHPDHYGLAGWLQAEAEGRPTVFMSAREAELAHLVWQEEAGWAEAVTTFWRNCGIPDELVTAVVIETDRTRQRTKPHPQTIQTIEPGTTIQLGQRHFQAIHTPGHSDGQLIFYDAEDGLLLCGDHVLQKITPNISLWPFGEPDPLGRYLHSLSQIAELEVRLVLPGHGPMITDLRGRIAQLAAHHEQRLGVMAAAVNGRATPFSVSQQVFDFDTLSIHEKRFAVAETLAHLEYLAWQGRLIKSTQPDAWLYNSL